MKRVNLVQGSPEWHQHRANHFNASDAPAMLGVSPYKTRSRLLAERATGIAQEVDNATQRRFNDGHRFEELARPLAEEIIGDELSPVTGVRDEYSASFDGIVFGNSVWWEHKSMNDELREILSRPGVTGADLPELYQVQLEHQAEVCEGDKCLFMASKWNDDGDLIEELHCWYTPNPALRTRICHGWIQFKKDLAEYQHVEQAAKPQAEAIMDLPALSVQATGMVTYSNLPEFKAAAEHYIANINTDLQTDQHFADAEATVKFCKATEEKLEVTKSAILAQTATIDEVIRTVDHIQAQLRDKRLMLDKLVKSEKEARKLVIVSKAREDFSKHIAALEDEIKPIKLSVLHPDLGGVIKGLKSLTSMQDAVDTALRNTKFTADTAAKDVRAKLTWCKDNAAGMSFLFPDLQQIISKPMDDFTLLIQSRIKEHKEAEARKAAELVAKIDAENAAKLEAERKRMEAEATAKAEREAAAKLAEETERIRQEEEAKAREKVAAEQAEARATTKIETYTLSSDTCDGLPAVTMSYTAPAQPEPVAKPSNVVVIEHQDEISAFLAARDFGKDAGRVRAILVEFVKFSETFTGKKAVA